MNNAIDLNVTSATEVPDVLREAAQQYDRVADGIDPGRNPLSYACWRDLADQMRLAALHAERRLGEYGC